MGEPQPILIVVMGVSGCGKSTVGHQLAEIYKAVFLDADDFHSAANIAKMSAGTPLTDHDRIDWIEAMRAGVCQQRSDVVILACSALTASVQKGLACLPRRLIYVHLNTENVDMQARLKRRDHFMPASLLDSQYEALTIPEAAHDFDANLPLPELLASIAETLSASLPLPEFH